MLSKLILVLAVTSLAAVAFRLFYDEESEAELKARVTDELDSLREHLFKR